MNELFTEIPELTALLRATIAVQRDKLEAANRAYALEAQNKPVVSDQTARKRATAEDNLGDAKFVLALLGRLERVEAIIRTVTDDWENDMNGWVRVRGEAFDQLLELRYVEKIEEATSQ